jgi:RimJ/RimL family protein N-acetyltransferase
MAKLGLDKIIVRRLVPEDRPLLRLWLNDPAVRQALEDETLDFSKIPETMALFESSDPFCDGALGLMVEVIGRPIGLIHFAWLNWINRNAEVIVLVGPGELRHSLGAAVVVEKIGHVAFRMLNLHKIYAFVYASNQDALSVFRKLMTEEARLHNYVKSSQGYGNLHCFGLLAGEYFAAMEKIKGRHICA